MDLHLVCVTSITMITSALDFFKHGFLLQRNYSTKGCTVSCSNWDAGITSHLFEGCVPGPGIGVASIGLSEGRAISINAKANDNL